MARFDVIESKHWVRDDGRTASIYGAAPWVSPSEEQRWKMVSRGYTVRDNERGTIGSGRQPWATRAEAQAWVDKETARLEEVRRRHEANHPKKAPAARGKRTHATKKTKKSNIGPRYPFGGTVGPSGYRELHDPEARIVYRVINPSTGIQHEFDDKAEALEKAAARAHKERGQVAVEQGTMTSAGIFRYDLDPQIIWGSEWRREAAPSASRQHALKKKSPAQLQREIDEVLASPGSFSYEEAMGALEKKHAGVKRGGSLRAGHAPVVPEMSRWRTRVFNTHHAAQGFLNRIKKKHVAVIEEHGASQWRVAYLPEGKGMPLNKP